MGVKHAELKQSKQEWKARVVIQGDGIQDHEGQAAVFQELASSASLMSASKLVDVIGMQPGYSVQQADAIQTFPQALLGGDETWVIIPPHRRPKEWAHLHTRVCRLKLALYGHPSRVRSGSGTAQIS